MKLLVIIAAVILVANATSDNDLWLKFKQKHGKGYRSLREDQQRFTIFQDNLRKIEAHNEKYERGEKSYRMGVTLYSDLTEEEFSALFNKDLDYASELKSEFVASVDHISLSDVPETMDWREKGVVTEVKSQGNCGGCWSFSATGAMESAYAIKSGNLISLSEQNLIDCSTAIGNHGCKGGTIHRAFSYSAQTGVELETDYPYVARDGTCSWDASKRALKLSTYATVPSGNEEALKKIVGTIGPVSVSISSAFFQNYDGGIIDEPSCTNTVDHGVLIVGYGEENGTHYWLVKNSWGEDWGENGYVKMARDKSGQCGIALYGVYPVL